MGIKDKEHYELIDAFEKAFPYKKTGKEPKEMWSKGNVYANGETNELFKAYRMGYAFGKSA